MAINIDGVGGDVGHGVSICSEEVSFTEKNRIPDLYRQIKVMTMQLEELQLENARLKFRISKCRCSEELEGFEMLEKKQGQWEKEDKGSARAFKRGKEPEHAACSSAKSEETCQNMHQDSESFINEPDNNISFYNNQSRFSNGEDNQGKGPEHAASSAKSEETCQSMYQDSELSINESDNNTTLCSNQSQFLNGDENSSNYLGFEQANEQGQYINTNVYAKRYVALKIMYFGQRFYGFASEAQMEPTVESEIFKALERTKLLIGTKKNAHYSRCGRTDKGVSATCQVISLYLRSKEKVAERGEEINYIIVLNRVLPKDIRVVGWAPISSEFSSRFSCLSREYMYLFWKGAMNILAMQKAAKKFIGEHDFRNFCKMDAVNVKNYRRLITEFAICPCNNWSKDDSLWAITIKGSAFLWHQVRCMVAVLFMVGEGLELPNIIDDLLDINKTPRKPQYKMASELPLMLHGCEFQDVIFICSPDARRSLQESFSNDLRTCLLQAAIIEEALCCLHTPDVKESSVEHRTKKKGHTTLMSRATEPSYEERRAKWAVKSGDGDP